MSRDSRSRVSRMWRNNIETAALFRPLYFFQTNDTFTTTNPQSIEIRNQFILSDQKTSRPFV
jgi:hypothetical protein